MQPLTLERGCHHTGQTLFGSSRTGRFCGLKATKDKEFAISKIRLFVCMLAVPTGSQEVYKNAPQRSVSVSYSLHFLLKGNRQFLWQLAHGEFQNLTDSDFSKHVRSAQIAVCQLCDLSSSRRKVKTDFSPFIVVVGIPMYCFVLVCSGGDFLFLSVSFNSTTPRTPASTNSPVSLSTIFL